MAEVVSEMQERLLPEYEELKQKKIFSPEQLKDCMRKRESFQLKITQSAKTPRNYIEYIAYEKKIHKLITLKEQSLGIDAFELKASIAQRIIHLYQDALKKFTHDTDLWGLYLEFSKKNAPYRVAGIYEKLLTFHGDNPNYWCNFAVWTYQYAKHMPRVNDIFLRGLQRHPSKMTLHKAFIDILLIDALKLSSKLTQGADKTEQELGLQRVEDVYKNSAKHITDVTYYIAVLERCEKYPDMTVKLQRMIINDLQEKFSHSEVVWDALAQRELRGFSMSDLQTYEERLLKQAQIKSTELDKTTELCDLLDDIEDKKVSIWESRSEKRRIELCNSVYETALKALPTNNMWTNYVSAMLFLNENTSTEGDLKRKLLARAFKGAHEKNLLQYNHYVTYLSIINGAPNGPEIAERVLTQAIKYKQEVGLYELLLDIHIKSNDAQKVYELFKSASKKFEDSFKIWKRTIDFYKTQTSPESAERLKEIFYEVEKSKNPALMPLQCDYLDYCFKTGGINKARQLYKEFTQFPPQYLTFHKKMISLEESLPTHTPEDISQLRECHEYMIYHFGYQDPRVWLDYIDFECKYGQYAMSHIIYARAKAALNGKLFKTFVEQFQLEKLSKIKAIEKAKKNT